MRKDKGVDMGRQRRKRREGREGKRKKGGGRKDGQKREGKDKPAVYAPKLKSWICP